MRWFFVFLVVFFSPLVCKTEQRSQPLYEKTHKKELISFLKAFDLQTEGLILVFHQLPSEKEKQFILSKTKKEGLVKTKELPLSKTWLFQWVKNKKQSVVKTDMICKEFSKISSIKHCQPDLLLAPQNNESRSSPAVFQENSGCNLIQGPANKNKKIAGLFWGQNMVGADLLKQELEKIQSKKSLAVTFHEPLNQWGGKSHFSHTSNMLRGKAGVLPEEKGMVIPINNGKISDSRKLYECVNTPKKDRTEWCNRIEQIGLSPHYINYSMGGNLERIKAIKHVYKFLLSPLPATEDECKEKKIKKIVSELEKSKKMLVGTDQIRLINNDIKMFKDQKLVDPFCKQLIEDSEAVEKNSISVLENGKKVINKGMNLEYKTLRELGGPDTIIVAASGNSAPYFTLPAQDHTSKEYDIIFVGSVDPTGRPSSFSQQGEAVHIMAPGGQVTTVDSEGKYETVNGTSFSTPLVTGSLMGFEWLSGYHPNSKEAKILLERTAISTKNSHDKPRKNGAGILNSYKLGMVGKRLKSQCGSNKNCFRQKINDPETYKFPKDQGLEDAVQTAFPDCSETCGFGLVHGNHGSCKAKIKVFERLRKASFLHPTDRNLKKYLACIYDSYGFTYTSFSEIVAYKALFGSSRNSEPAHTFCKKDADCVLVPDCVKKNNSFLSMTQAQADIIYAMGSCKKEKTLCNRRCRCRNQEKVTLSGKTKTYSRKCVNSRCTLKVKTEQSPNQKEGSLVNSPSPLQEFSGPVGQR